MDYLSLLLCPAMPFYDYARQYVSVCSAIFYGVYCYMKLQGYIRLVNVTRIYYTMDYLSLLTDSPTQFYGYATVVYSACTAMTVELSI